MEGVGGRKEGRMDGRWEGKRKIKKENSILFLNHGSFIILVANNHQFHTIKLVFFPKLYR